MHCNIAIASSFRTKRMWPSLVFFRQWQLTGSGASHTEPFSVRRRIQRTGMYVVWSGKPEAGKWGLHTAHREHYLSMDFGANCLGSNSTFSASLILRLSLLFCSVKTAVVETGWMGGWVIKTHKTFRIAMGTWQIYKSISCSLCKVSIDIEKGNKYISFSTCNS